MIKEYTNHTTKLAVTRNGQPDQEYYNAMKRAEYLDTALSHLGVVGAGLLTGLGLLAKQVYKGLEHVSFLLHLELFDAAHGTNLRAEYFNEKRKHEIAELRAQFR